MLKRRIGPISMSQALESKVLDLFNVKYVLTAFRGETPRSQPTKLLNGDFLPRAFVVTKPHMFSHYGEMLAYLKTGDFDPRREVLLEEDTSGAHGAAPDRRADASGGAFASPPEDAPAVAWRAEIVKREEADLTIDVETAAPGYQVVSDVFYPDWRVSVDGIPKRLLRADYAFRAVAIEPGRHTVDMRYKPRYFTLGLLFSVAGIAFVALMVLAAESRTASEGGRS